ncbi:hypothetical protein [Streptomyces sp. NBC_01497]|nr:hypothetical protein [Streptomyces sp. NBC_01497]
MSGDGQAAASGSGTRAHAGRHGRQTAVSRYSTPVTVDTYARHVNAA